MKKAISFQNTAREVIGAKYVNIDMIGGTLIMFLLIGP
jgi:hypothetical protein